METDEDTAHMGCGDNRMTLRVTRDDFKRLMEEYDQVDLCEEAV